MLFNVESRENSFAHSAVLHSLLVSQRGIFCMLKNETDIPTDECIYSSLFFFISAQSIAELEVMTPPAVKATRLPPNFLYACQDIYLSFHDHITLICRSPSELTTLSRYCVGTYDGNELTRNSSGDARPQSSQLVEPLWTDRGIKSGISVRELISTLKKRSAGGE